MRVVAGQGPTTQTNATDHYWVMDLAGNWNMSDNLSLFARVENMLDEVYIAAWRPAGARPGRPRTALVGISASF
jgi:Fe(3+) dicitrate transport protein